jgi:hypothetical protein
LLILNPAIGHIPESAPTASHPQNQFPQLQPWRWRQYVSSKRWYHTTSRLKRTLTFSQPWKSQISQFHYGPCWCFSCIYNWEQLYIHNYLRVLNYQSFSTPVSLQQLKHFAPNCATFLSLASGMWNGLMDRVVWKVVKKFYNRSHIPTNSLNVALLNRPPSLADNVWPLPLRHVPSRMANFQCG